MAVKVDSALPYLFDMDQARRQKIFCITVFFTALFKTALENHPFHWRFGGSYILWRQPDCANDEKHEVKDSKTLPEQQRDQEKCRGIAFPLAGQRKRGFAG